MSTRSESRADRDTSLPRSSVAGLSLITHAPRVKVESPASNGKFRAKASIPPQVQVIDLCSDSDDAKAVETAIDLIDSRSNSSMGSVILCDDHGTPLHRLPVKNKTKRVTTPATMQHPLKERSGAFDKQTNIFSPAESSTPKASRRSLTSKAVSSQRQASASSTSALSRSSMPGGTPAFTQIPSSSHTKPPPSDTSSSSRSAVQSAISPAKKAAMVTSQRLKRMSSVEWEALIASKMPADAKGPRVKAESPSRSITSSPRGSQKPLPGSAQDRTSQNSRSKARFTKPELSPLKQSSVAPIFRASQDGAARSKLFQTPRGQKADMYGGRESLLKSAPADLPSRREGDASGSNAPFRPSTTSTPITNKAGSKVPLKKRQPRPSVEDEESYRPPSSPFAKPVVPKSVSKKRQSHLSTIEDEESYRPAARPTSLANTPEPKPSMQRPTRVRLKAGAYTLPTPETSIHDWPRIESTHTAVGSSWKRKERVKTTGIPLDNTGAEQRSRSPTKTEIHQVQARKSSTESSLTPLPSRSDSITMSRTSSKLSSNSSSLSASPVKGVFKQLFEESVIDAEQLNPGVKSNDTMQDVGQLESEEEEEEEPMEAEQELDPFAMLADFEGYDWASSGEEDTTDPVEKEGGASPRTPSRACSQQTKGTPSKASLTPRKSNGQLSHLTPSKSVAPEDPATPRSSVKRPQPLSSPASSNKKRKALMEKYEGLLAQDRAQRELEREAERQKAREMQRNLDKALGRASQEEQDETVDGDMSAFLNHIATKSSQNARHNKSVDSPVKSAAASRYEAKQSADEARALARKEAKRKAILEARQAASKRARRKENRKFEDLLAAIPAVEMAEQALQDIKAQKMGENNDSRSGRESYPTPSSGDDDTSSDPGLEDTPDVGGDVEADDDMDLDEMVDRARKQGMVVDDELLQAAKAADRPDEGVDKPEWEGFWTGVADAQQGDSIKVTPIDFEHISFPLWGMIEDAAKQQDTRLLCSIFSSGAAYLPGSPMEECLRWLLENALYSSDPSWALVAQETFVHTCELQTSQNDRSDALSLISEALGRLGGKPDVVDRMRKDGHTPSPGRWRLTINRERLLPLMCTILHSINASSVSWPSSLLMLSVDPATPALITALLRSTGQKLLIESIRRALEALDSDVVQRLVMQVANDLVPYADDVRVAVLDAIGQASREIRMLRRWLAMHFLTGVVGRHSGSLPDVPPVPYLLEAVQMMHQTLSGEEEPDWTGLDRKVSFLYAAVSDMDGLLKQHPVDMAGDKGVKDLMRECAIEEVRHWIRLCRDKISDQSNGTSKALVKARLHQLHEITRLILSIAIKKQLRVTKLGKGLKAGEHGQSRLDFGVRQVDEPESEVEG
ncbi:hypothetical protein IAU60_005595 [Kwoniella sp. DSM 27419]